jgi:hypothetical protein
MIRVFARWWAKMRYIWKQEVEAATAELHAGLSLKLATEKRARISNFVAPAKNAPSFSRKRRPDHGVARSGRSSTRRNGYGALKENRKSKSNNQWQGYGLADKVEIPRLFRSKAKRNDLLHVTNPFE